MRELQAAALANKTLSEFYTLADWEQTEYRAYNHWRHERIDDLVQALVKKEALSAEAYAILNLAKL